jgi:hypothetical protein
MPGLVALINCLGRLQQYLHHLTLVIRREISSIIVILVQSAKHLANPAGSSCVQPIAASRSRLICSGSHHGCSIRLKQHPFLHPCTVSSKDLQHTIVPGVVIEWDQSSQRGEEICERLGTVVFVKEPRGRHEVPDLKQGGHSFVYFAAKFRIVSQTSQLAAAALRFLARSSYTPSRSCWGRARVSPERPAHTPVWLRCLPSD